MMTQIESLDNGMHRLTITLGDGGQIMADMTEQKLENLARMILFHLQPKALPYAG